MLPVLLLFSGLPGKATHLVGGYMSYEFLQKLDNGNYVYKVTINVFRDCKNSTVQFDDPIKVGIYLNDGGSTNKHNLYRAETFRKIFERPVEPPGNANCGYFADNVCIRQAFYEKTVILAPNPNGYHLTFIRCCRNHQNNLPDGPNGDPYQGQTYYGFIPNPELQNSSPRFSGVPSPFMCANDVNSFLNSAFDKDGDSLVYRPVQPFQGGSPAVSQDFPDPTEKLELPIQGVTYNSGYSYLAPFGSSGLFDVDPVTGLTKMMSTKTGSFVVGVVVIEYRNGIELSRTRLDLQILVLDCPPNLQPRVEAGPQHIELEAGQSVCFDVTGSDPDNDNVTIEGVGDIFEGKNDFSPQQGYNGPLATLPTRTANTRVTSTFCWSPPCEAAREKVYSFSVKVTDDGCPPKFDIESYTIKINKFVGSDEIRGPDRSCANSVDYLYRAVDPKAGSTFLWEVTNGEIIGPGNRDSVRIKWTGSGTGALRMTEISRFGCPGDPVDKTVTLVQSPPTPVITGRDTVCLNTLDEPYSVPFTANVTYKWMSDQGNISFADNNEANVSWPVLGDHFLAVTLTNSDGCESDTGFIYVNVRKPAPVITGPFSVCPNASDIEYKAIGGSASTFNWAVSGGSFVAPSVTNSVFVNWGDVGIGNIRVTETDKFGCVSDPVSINVIIDHNLQGQVPSGDISVCEFDLKDYFVNLSNGSVYDWVIAGGNQMTGDSSSDITVQWATAGPGRVGVRERAYDPVNDQFCMSPYRYLDVTINPTPSADVIEGTTDLCATTDSFTYTINGMAGSTYEWKVNGLLAGFKGQGSNTIRLPWPDDGTFRLEVQELSRDSCPGEVVDTLIYVRPIPDADEITGPAVVCAPDLNNVVYSVDGFPGSTYFWQVVNGTIAGPDNGSQVEVNWQTSQYGSISTVEISEFGCVGDTIYKEVYVNQPDLNVKVISVQLPDDKIFLKWETGDDPLVGAPFTIERRILGNDTWTPVASTDRRSYTDQGLNTDENIYQYRIISRDLCGNLITSEIHTHIQVTGILMEDGFGLRLNFTPYMGWEDGVRLYELYRSYNDETDYTLVGSYNPGDPVFIDSDADSYRRCFRVKGYEDTDQAEVTWSNEICFYFTPDVFIPNAFTPNGKEPNEKFNTVTSAIKDYNIQIYNRWGELLFETDQPDQGWDGTYGGVKAPMGVYFYVVTFSDYQDQSFSKSGTIHLIR